MSGQGSRLGRHEMCLARVAAAPLPNRSNDGPTPPDCATRAQKNSFGKRLNIGKSDIAAMHVSSPNGMQCLAKWPNTHATTSYNWPFAIPPCLPCTISGEVSGGPFEAHDDGGGMLCKVGLH